MVLHALHEEIDEQEWAVYACDFDALAVEENARFKEEVRKKFRELSQAEAERRGDVSGIGARYGYISFEGAGLLVNRASRNLIAKLHGTLCHPSNIRLSRMMNIAGFSKEMVEAAKALRCQICERVAAPQSFPKINERRPTAFNVLVGTDSFCIFSCDSRSKFWVCHFVDSFNT